MVTSSVEGSRREPRRHASPSTFKLLTDLRMPSPLAPASDTKKTQRQGSQDGPISIVLRVGERGGACQTRSLLPPMPGGGQPRGLHLTPKHCQSHAALSPASAALFHTLPFFEIEYSLQQKRRTSRADTILCPLGLWQPVDVPCPRYVRLSSPRCSPHDGRRLE